MTHPSPSIQRTQVLYRHLRDNESHCIRRNIIVRVDTMNAEQNVAFCTVQQRLTGFFRRTYSVHELVGRGEKALAPLKELGIIPLLTVQHKNLSVAPTVQASPKQRPLADRFDDLWRWLGYPFSREGFGATPLLHDPFGWKQAMNASSFK